MRPVSGLRQYDVPSNTTVSQPASASRLLTSPLLMPPPRLRVPSDSSDSSRIHHRRVGCTVGGAPTTLFPEPLRSPPSVVPAASRRPSHITPLAASPCPAA